jgi:pimeloyl-ACP methyl ester carboxylesterase
MSTVISKDGTKIAYEPTGKGPAVIFVDGALVHRAFGDGMAEAANLLAPQFTVYRYDRRGRGESTDTQPYDIEREFEDLEAMIGAAGGSAFVYGISSGGSLAMEAALKLGSKVKKLAIYEAPYNDDPAAQQAWREYTHELKKLLEADRRGDAAALFLKTVGTPVEQINGMRQSPYWAMFEAVAPTLAYDNIAIMGEDRATPTQRLAQVRVPTLVMAGGADYPFMRVTAKKLAEAIPGAQLRYLDGQTHNVAPEAIAPVLTEFFSDWNQDSLLAMD